MDVVASWLLVVFRCSLLVVHHCFPRCCFMLGLCGLLLGDGCWLSVGCCLLFACDC